TRLRREAAGSLAAAHTRTTHAAERLARRPATALRQAEQALDAVDARVRALDPASVLARGWSTTRRPDGTLVRTAASLAAGDELVTTFADGSVQSRVEGEPR